MLFNSFVASALVLALTSSVNAQGAVFSPALGNASPGVGDVQRPSTGAPCGKPSLPISKSDLASSTPIPVDSNMRFSFNVQSFGYANISRSISSAFVDPKGTGENFGTTGCKIITDGTTDPSAPGKQTVTLELPEGTSCSGGDNGKLCLAAIKTEQGYGNCLVLTQADTTTGGSTTTNGGKAQADGLKGSKTGQNGKYTDSGDQVNQKQTNGTKADQTKSNDAGGDKSTGKNQKRSIRRRL